MSPESLTTLSDLAQTKCEVFHPPCTVEQDCLCSAWHGSETQRCYCLKHTHCLSLLHWKKLTLSLSGWLVSNLSPRNEPDLQKTSEKQKTVWRQRRMQPYSLTGVSLNMSRCQLDWGRTKSYATNWQTLLEDSIRWQHYLQQGASKVYSHCHCNSHMHSITNRQTAPGYSECKVIPTK